MNELEKPLTQLLGNYRELFGTERICVIGEKPGDFRNGLPDEPGVYIVWTKKLDQKVVYVGSTGKIENNGNSGIRWGKGTLKKRCERWTPYFFNDENLSFMHGPKYGTREQRYAQDAYTYRVPLKDIVVEYFEFHKNVTWAPAVLEHILIQGHLNQYGYLPPANQAI